MARNKDYHREYMRKRRAGEVTVNDNGFSHLIEKLQWKFIPGYSGYKVSKCGYVLSCKRTKIRSNGRRHTTPARVLKHWPDTNGYYQVYLYLNDKKVARSNHRLVYLAWKGEIPVDMVVDHIDADKLNNHADNLQLLSNQMNVIKGWEDAKKKAYEAGYTEGYKAGIEAQKLNAQLVLTDSRQNGDDLSVFTT